MRRVCVSPKARGAIPALFVKRLFSVKPEAALPPKKIAECPERQGLVDCERVVVKVGTAIVSKPDGRLALSRMGALVEEIADLVEAGKQVMLVSSGAVGLGRERMGLSKEVVSNVQNVVERQACAAAGQEVLMSTYDMMFNRLGLKSAQVLITQGDFLMPDRYTYLTNTLTRLCALGVVPIINENDAVTGSMQLDPSTSGRVFTDNDMLSSLVAAGTRSQGLCMLTDVDAVFTKPPDEPGAERIKVYTADREVVIGEKSTMGRGGMGSKIYAARVAAQGGVHCCIANGIDVRNISRVFAGTDIGTLFPPETFPSSKHQHWLAFSAQPSGMVGLSEEAVQRLRANQNEQDEALFNIRLVDIVKCDGQFPERSTVSVVDQHGKEIGRAQVQANSQEIQETIGIGNAKEISFHNSRLVAKAVDIVMMH